MKRKIIKIDQELCTGCGNCIPNCPEGALQIIDSKARLVSDLFCDGLGACLGECPEGAISVEEREAEPYSEEKVMANIVTQGDNTIKAHLEHLFGHKELELYNQALKYLKDHKIAVPKHKTFSAGCTSTDNDTGGGCPGSRAVTIEPTSKKGESSKKNASGPTAASVPTQLRNFPIQITLVPPRAPYFNGADLLLASDCTAFSYGNFHQDLIKGKVLLMGCPKLDDSNAYIEKMSSIFMLNQIKSITLVIMEVPCCGGMEYILQEALKRANKQIPVQKYMVHMDGGLEQLS